MFDAATPSAPSTTSRLRSAVADRVAIDTRALAALRIGLGGLLLLDLTLRARSLTAFYTDAGVLPRAAVADLYPTISRLSLHMLAGDAVWQAGLFLLAAGVAIALVLGYHARLATVASLVLLVSLHVRNPVVLNAGDVLLRRLLLWSCFLPLGARWSLDARRSPDVRPPSRVATLATAAVLLQVVTIYTINAAFKLQSEAWHSGDAVRRALAMDSFSTPLGDLLVDVPVVLEVATWAWVALVAAAPLLVLATGRVRTALVVGFATMHVGMALTMLIGLFPVVSVVALLPFLPTGVWDRLSDRFDERTPFDPTGRRWPIDRGGSSRQGTAVSRTWTLGTGARVVLVLLVVLAGSWNLVTLGAVPAAAIDHGRVSPDVMAWDMFATPGTSDLEYETTVTLDAGATRDDVLLSGALADRTMTAWTGYPSARWRKYLVSIRYADPPGLVDDLGAYLCHRAAIDADSPPASVAVSTVQHPTRYASSDAPTRTPLGTYPCS